MVLSAFKQSCDHKDYIIRLYNSMAHSQNATVAIPSKNIQQAISLSPFEVQTYKLGQNQLFPISLLEDDID